MSVFFLTVRMRSEDVYYKISVAVADSNATSDIYAVTVQGRFGGQEMVRVHIPCTLCTCIHIRSAK